MREQEQEKRSIGEKIGYCVLAAVLLSIPIGIFTVWICAVMANHTSIYIQDVYVPTLDTTTNITSTANGTTPSFDASIFVDLKYHSDMPAFSDPIEDSELVVFYGHGIIPVAGYRVGTFGIGRHTNVHKMAAMEAPELPWEEAFRAVSAGLTVELAVELRKVRRTNDKDVLAANVAVDASGHMVPKGHDVGLT